MTKLILALTLGLFLISQSVFADDSCPPDVDCALYYQQQATPQIQETTNQQINNFLNTLNQSSHTQPVTQTPVIQPPPPTNYNSNDPATSNYNTLQQAPPPQQQQNNYTNPLPRTNNPYNIQY